MVVIALQAVFAILLHRGLPASYNQHRGRASGLAEQSFREFKPSCPGVVAMFSTNARIRNLKWLVGSLVFACVSGARFQLRGPLTPNRMTCR